MTESSLLKEIAALKERITELEESLAAALQLNEYYRQQLHGSKSERYDPAQGHLDFDESVLGKAEPSAEDGQPGEGEEVNQKKAKSKRTRRTKDQLFPRWIKSVVTEEIIPDEVRANPEAYREIEVREHRELEIVRASLYWRVTRIPRYVRKDDKAAKPLGGCAPPSSVPGTLCGPGLISQIICDKFCDHLPHYRQSQRFLRQHGVELRRSTINQWTGKLAELLQPIDEAIKAEVLDTDLLQIDETPGNYLAPGTGKTQTGYWWAYRNPNTGAVYFDWHTSRAMECLLEMLGYDEESHTLLFTGLIQCDGYSAYQKLFRLFTGLTLAGCLAHLRRKFFEAREQAPELVLPILLKIQDIYRVEREMQQSNAPPGCRELIRRARSLPHFDQLETLIQTASANRPLPASKLGKALTYARNQWDKVKASALDPRLDLDTNKLENKIRPLKLGLKNYLFMGSADAGKDAALIYTVIENCKVHGIDPERYLVEVIEALRDPTAHGRAAELTPGAIAKARKTARLAETA